MHNTRHGRTRAGKNQHRDIDQYYMQSYNNKSMRTATGSISEAAKYWECSQLEDNSLSKRLKLRSWGMKRLLKQGNPFKPEIFTIRETSKTHRRKVEID